MSSSPLTLAKTAKGVVTDIDGHPLEFANVSALAHTRFITGCVTDSTGRFYMEVPDSCDHLRATFIGYENRDVALQPGIDMAIRLSPTATHLKEVTVTAPLFRREADRIIVNVAANPMSAGKDAHMLLKTAPGVWATDQSLSIYGQGGTTVYIDDRKVNLSGDKLATYLKGIGASSIATIEIIPRAGAEYDADSSGGVIRINLRHNRIDGLTGSAGMNTTAGKEKVWLNPFLSLSLHSGKWTADLSGNLNGSPSDRYTSREESVNTTTASTLSGTSRHKKTALQGNIIAGVFFTPTPADRIGLQVEYFPDRQDSRASSQTIILGGMFHSLTSGEYHNRQHSHDLNVTLNLSHRSDTLGSTLKWISTYTHNSSSLFEDNLMTRDIPVSPDSAYTTDNLNRYRIFVTDISLLKCLTPRASILAGIKYTRNNVSYKSSHQFLLYGAPTPNPSYDQDDRYHEDLLALYLSANLRHGRWHFKAGLRGEYTHTDGSGVSTSHFDLFPNANISFDLTANGQYALSAGYYRNIRRPSFRSLNPVVTQVSDYSYTAGNPGLAPSFTNSASLDLLLNGRYTIAAGYSHTGNPIRQMFTSDPRHPQQMCLTWGNLGDEHSGFIHADGFISITRWLNFYGSLTWAMTSQLLDTGRDTFGYLQAVASATITLPYGFSFQINGFFQSKMKIGNITVYPLVNINPTLQKRLGKTWTVSLSGENLLGRQSKIRANSGGIDRLTSTTPPAAGRLSVTYNFSTGKRFRAPKIERNTDNSRLADD